MTPFCSTQWNTRVTQSDELVYCSDANIKRSVLMLELCSLSIRAFLPGVCQSRHAGWSEVVEWYWRSASDRWLWDFGWSERDRWPTPSCLHAAGGNADLYLHRTVVQHASVLSVGPAVSLGSVLRSTHAGFMYCVIFLSTLCLRSMNTRNVLTRAGTRVNQG